MFSSLHEQMQPFFVPRPMPMNRRWKPDVEIAPNCPRCDSSDTKFCYYNNYSLTQPRYFCKACRRYWTKGGSLRNVPVGGGCRKSRRGKSAKLPSRQVGTVGSNADIRTRQDPISALRPGLALDEMVGSSRPPTASTMPESTIDLAALYAVFLNQRPEDEPVPEFSDCELVGSEGIREFEYPLEPFRGLSWETPEQLQSAMCPFSGMESDWSPLDHSSFGSF